MVMKKLSGTPTGTDRETSFRHRAIAKKGGITDAAGYLTKVAAIKLKLENGEEVEFDPAKELMIPTDPLMIRRELLRAPSQLAFIAYQCERAHAEVRRLEREEEKASGTASLTYRAWYRDHQGESYTEDMIRSRVSIDPKVCEARDYLIAARNLYGVLRATRDAVEHRVYALRKIVGNDGDGKPG